MFNNNFSFKAEIVTATVLNKIPLPCPSGQRSQINYLEQCLIKNRMQIGDQALFSSNV